MFINGSIHNGSIHNINVSWNLRLCWYKKSVRVNWYADSDKCLLEVLHHWPRKSSKFFIIFRFFSLKYKSYNWLYVLIMSRAGVRVNPHSIVAWMSRNSLLETRLDIWNLSDCSGTRTHNHLVPKRELNHLANLTSLA